VDATVILTFRDSGMIVQPYQVESLSLVTDNGGVVPCTIGTVPEFDLSVGYVWQTPIQVGGYSNYVSDEDFEQLCFAINDEMQEGYALDILFNSGDLHTDTGIGVQDVVIFKVKYTDLEYHYEIDYHFDKRIDLADLVLFAASLNTVCP